jgi:hypothetical protein
MPPLTKESAGAKAVFSVYLYLARNVPRRFFVGIFCKFFTFKAFLKLRTEFILPSSSLVRL